MIDRKKPPKIGIFEIRSGPFMTRKIRSFPKSVSCGENMVDVFDCFSHNKMACRASR